MVATGDNVYIHVGRGGAGTVIPLLGLPWETYLLTPVLQEM